MENKARNSKGRSIIQTIILLFFLIGLPFGSYVYLKKGYDYHKTALDELNKDNSMPALTGWQNLSGALPDSMGGNMFIVGFVEPGDATSEQAYGQALQRLHNQFDVPANIFFLTLLKDGDSTWVANFQEDYQLDDPEQLVYLMANEGRYSTTAQEFGLTEAEINSLMADPRMAMVDDSLYVRIIYQTKEELQLKRLVEQTAMLLPNRRPNKPELVRETEK